MRGWQKLQHSSPATVRLFATGLVLLVFAVTIGCIIMVHMTAKAQHITLANGTQVLLYNDVHYCGDLDARRQLDLYVPSTASSKNPAPLILYIHGGGWKEGTFRNGIDHYYPQFLLTKGIAFATIDYRLAPNATYPSQDTDSNCAYTFLMQHATKFGIRPTRIGIMGDSAGGQLAAMEALTGEAHNNTAAVALLYPVTDLWYQITEKDDRNALLYLGTRDEEIARRASPLFAPLTTTASFLLLHGESDTVVPISNSQRFYDRLIANGIDAQLITFPGAGHGFGDNANSKEQKEAEPYITSFFVQHLQP